MLLPALLALALPGDSVPVYSGQARHLNVQVPRIEATVTIDGKLDEPVWARAAKMTGFSQYQPVDGRPAEEPTEVLVWYAPDAIYFGVRAREIHGDVVRATRANRDNIASEDQIQLLLDTYNDRRLAFLFGVNPLGVQQDGTRSDQFGGGAGGHSATGGGTTNINPLEGTVDLNPDYIFESRGRLVEGGYEVEIRIPFKSLHYQDRATQSWGINVLRRVQHSGYQDSWAPAVRANASFIGQSGTLEGLHDLRRGLVLEVTPTATGRMDGAPEPSGQWGYQSTAEFGADLRWGVRQNLTANATYNPDFSQVEADVGQVLLNERFALFYPEKRPFFLESLELFDTPNQLIYTRQIEAPRGGIKLAGKVAGTNVGAMLVADDTLNSWTGGHNPLFGIARVRHDLKGNSTVGGIFTTREDGQDYSRLTGGDIRLYHSKLYYVELQGVQSWTDSAGTAKAGPLFMAAWDRTGRAWGFHYNLQAVAPGFNAAAGFVNRTGVLDARAFNRFSFYGDKDALVQTWGAFVGLERLWDYAKPAGGSIEGNESLSPSATLRGGWQLGGSVTRSFFSYDPAQYQDYTVEAGTGSQADTVAFEVPGPERNQWGLSFRVTTPTYRIFTATASLTSAETPIFREAAPGKGIRIDASVDLRPMSALRGTLQFSRQTIDRARDGSRYSTEMIPRLKVEYQVTRAIFLRLIGQYTERDRSALEDRNGNPILVDGVKDEGGSSNEFRMDWLFSYRPIPGTLFYFGYGSTLDQPQQTQPREFKRTADGFFVKLSYLFRL